MQTFPGAFEVALDSAREGADSIRAEIERFYATRVQEAHARGVRGALRPHRTAGRAGWLGGLDDFLTEHADVTGESAMLHELSDLGVVWEAAPMRWELGIPSFGDFLRRQPVARPGPVESSPR